MLTRRTPLLAALAALGALCFTPASAEPKTDFKVAWSIYAGWMPWGYAAEHGIVQKWADKYGLKIEVTQFNDYVESINQYTAGAYDAVTLTNMDGLSIPAAGGVDTTAVIVGDFSNGNDAVILKDKTDLKDIKGQDVNLVEFSVSHYLLARALDSVGMSERDVKVVNTADPDMVGAFQTPDVTAMVTWNPMVSEILKLPAAHKVFDSAQIPGEIIDMMVGNTETLKDNPDFGKALAGIWYETVQLMASDTAEGGAARAAMGTTSGTDQAGFEEQLAATKLFDKGLLGAGAPSADVVGIEFPDASVLGDSGNVKLRFDATWMKQAADGAL